MTQLRGLAAIAAAVASLAAASLAKPDPDMQKVLNALIALGSKPIATLSPAEARRQLTPADAVKLILERADRDTTPTTLVPGVTSRDREVKGAVGMLPARIYTPEGKGPFPVIVYYHGGGWVIANKEVYDAGARGIAKQAGAVVVSADYRLAPEHKLPAQHDDALAVYRWALDNARTWPGRADQPSQGRPQGIAGRDYHQRPD